MPQSADTAWKLQVRICARHQCRPVLSIQSASYFHDILLSCGIASFNKCHLERRTDPEQQLANEWQASDVCVDLDKNPVSKRVLVPDPLQSFSAIASALASRPGGDSA